MGLPAGGSDESGAMVWLPKVGDAVYVQFLDAEPEKPVWTWGTQTKPQSEKFPYWKKPGGYSAGQNPDSSYMTRHGHVIEISPKNIILQTATGYTFAITDADGAGGTFGLMSMITMKGYTFEFNDETDTLTINVPNIQALFEVGTFVGSRAIIAVQELFQVITSSMQVAAGEATHTIGSTEKHVVAEAFSVTSPRVALGQEFASDSVVRLSDLLKVCLAIMSTFNAHKHVGNLGRPTSSPTSPMNLSPTGSKITFSA